MESASIIFDIERIVGKRAEGRLIIFKDKTQYSLFPCLSGPWGKGFLPIGKYKVVSCYEKDNTDENKPYKRDGIPWVAGIIPKFKTDRNNLAIHPDGNVVGSLGCVVITKRDMEAKKDIENLIKKHNVLTFKVLYHDSS